MESRKKTTLDDVFNTFVAENDRPTAENLQEWIKRYPQYQRELVDFAVAWAEQLVLPPAPELGPEAEKALIDRAMSHVLNVAYERDMREQQWVESYDSAHNLTRKAQRAGVNVQELAEACSLDLVLISKLNNRQIKPETIPPQLVNLLGKLLWKSTTVISLYFAKPPQATTDKAFLALRKPKSTGQQSFVDAVRMSSLSEEKKTRWLNEEISEEA